MTVLQKMAADAARTAFCQAYGQVLRSVADIIRGAGHDFPTTAGPYRVSNVSFEDGYADPVVRVGFLDSESPDVLCVEGESGTVYPVGTDIDDQDRYILSNPLGLLNFLEGKL